MKDQKQKVSTYAMLVRQIESLIAGEQDETAVLANVAAALHDAFPEEYFWVGFYIVKNDELLLGPFQGPVACYHIARGKGVCGTAWEQRAAIVVSDVERFPGHIACSSLSRSEIVVPIFDSLGRVRGVIDVDSRELNAFNDTDREYLARIAAIIASQIYSR
ncbi:MAG: GAF domain-containing protein [Prevotella sp.]|nr:GAF domain-containing protein [Prevotella sp.]MDY4039622.1 GAF domain-containing protein [Prevotella sp.]